LNTTKGLVDESSLQRTLGFEDRPDQYVVWIHWKLDGELVRAEAYPLLKSSGDTLVTSHGELPAASLVRTIELLDLQSEIVVVEVYRLGEEIVKRSPHVILKQASVVADAIAGTF
jgi:hypothetical protein